MKMFVSVLGTETNTFSPVPTGLNVWKDMLLVHRDEEIKGIFDPAAFLGNMPKDRGWELSRGLFAYAYPAGLTPQPVYESLRDEILEDLKSAMPVDAVALLLHGAMVAQGYDDCEGDLLSRIRDIVGPDIPVGAELDLHCHMTDTMLDKADVLIGYKEYPHTDIVQRWLELFNVMADTAEGKINPVMSSYDCRMIGLYHTNTEPMYGFVRYMEELEKQPGIISAWLVHCFPWGDVPFIGAKSVVIADGDSNLAASTAEKIGKGFFSLRNEAASRPVTIEETIQTAESEPLGPVTIADTGDNPGGGAPSDSTFFLEALMAKKLENSAIATIWDPIAVKICQDGGVGAQLQIRIGGKMGPTSGDPIDVTATVTGLADEVTQEYGGIVTSMGNCAALKVHLDNKYESAPDKGIDVVLCQNRVQTANPNIFSDLGIDPLSKKILVVKSTQHFQAAFAPISKKILYAGDKGTLQNDVTHIPYRKVDTSSYWPFVDDPFKKD